MLSDFDGTVQDEARWRKRNGITATTPIFIMSGWYPDIKRALVQRGWRQNPNRDSPIFDLMWVLKGKSIKHNKLRPHQVCAVFCVPCVGVWCVVAVCHTMLCAGCEPLFQGHQHHHQVWPDEKPAPAALV